jgi:hypothetical protein
MPDEKTENNESMKNEQKEAVELQNQMGEKDARKEMEQLRSDVDKLSVDLKATVTELKRSIVDIRSAVSEIENPFNLLRTISSEKDLKKISNDRLPLGVKSLVLDKPEGSAFAEDEHKEKPLDKPAEIQPQESSTPPETETKAETPELHIPLEPRAESPRTGSAFLGWVWDLLNLGLSSDDIQQLALSYESIGYLPTSSNEHIFPLAMAVEKLRSKGFTKGQVLLNMYKAASISGIKVGAEDMGVLISIAESKLRKARDVE